MPQSQNMRFDLWLIIYTSLYVEDTSFACKSLYASSIYVKFSLHAFIYIYILRLSTYSYLNNEHDINETIYELG